MLLPHPGCCSLLPTAPVVAACWMLPLAADPAVALVLHTHACMLLYGRRHVEKSDIISDDVGSLALLPELTSSSVLAARRPQWH